MLRDSDVGIKSILEGIPRQNIDEIYLFFDFDIHQDNLGKNDNDRFDVVRKMLDFFNNETENGKLYISYPMVEALYDYKNGLCESNYNCFISIDVVKDYKKLSSDNNDNVNRTKDFNSWRSILNVFSLKIKCLFDLDELNFTIYRDKVSTLSIYELEEKMLENENKIFVLSAFPEFLFDYFKVDFWKSMNKIKKNKYNNCRKIK